MEGNSGFPHTWLIASFTNKKARDNFVEEELNRRARAITRKKSKKICTNKKDFHNFVEKEQNRWARVITRK